ncbi:hypothetical protein H4R33_006825, partial [Dimargaris cristalligena]
MQPRYIGLLSLAVLSLLLNSYCGASATNSNQLGTKEKTGLQDQVYLGSGQKEGFASNEALLGHSSNSKGSDSTKTSAEIDRLSILPGGLLDRILDISLNAKTYPELMKTSRVVARRTLDRPTVRVLMAYDELQASLKRYEYYHDIDSPEPRERSAKILKANRVTRRHNRLVATRATFDPWQKLLRHQFAILFWRYACVTIRTAYTVENIDGAERLTSETGGIDKYHLHSLLIIGQGSPAFEQDARRFIDPTQLSPDTLTKQLPHLHLVEVYKNSSEIIEVLVTLTNPRLHGFVNSEWKQARVSENGYAKGPLVNLVEFLWKPDYSEGLENPFIEIATAVTAQIMAYLALKGYHVLFHEFVAGLRKTQAGYRTDYRSSLGEFGTLAVILGAITGQVDLVRMLPHNIIGIPPDSRTPPTMLQDNCSIAKVMHQINLVKSAEFLEATLECPKSRFDQLPEEDRKADEPNFRYLRQLRLVDSGE